MAELTAALATKANEGERLTVLLQRLATDFPNPYAYETPHFERFNARRDAWASYMAELETMAGEAQRARGRPVVAWLCEDNATGVGDLIDLDTPPGETFRRADVYLDVQHAREWLADVSTIADLPGMEGTEGRITALVCAPSEVTVRALAAAEEAVHA